MSRIALTKIPSLTFYKDSRTLSRRVQPIPQLTCIGQPCKLYQPEAVRCTNLGGFGTDVDWKCEADLPDSLRFGRVEVSCEGWDGPGDPYVLKGSCGLEYRLVQVPRGLRGGAADEPSYPARFSRWVQSLAQDPTAFAFMLLWIIVLVLILFSALKSCFGSRTRPTGPSSRPPPPRRPNSGWFSGGGLRPDTHDSPPPYSKYPSSTTPGTGAAGAEGWRPGFWTGAALGGLGTYFMNRQARDRARETTWARPAPLYDWETERILRQGRPQTSATSWWGGSGMRRGPVFDNDDRGEGPSDLGRMRRSTGLGGSNVR